MPFATPSPAHLKDQLTGSLDRIAAVTGPLPADPTWNRIARDSRKLGIDPTMAAKTTWDTWYKSVDYLAERQGIRWTLSLRLTGILLLAITVRIYLMIALNQEETSWPLSEDLLLCGSGLITTGCVWSRALQAMPLCWTVEHLSPKTAPIFSQDFFSFVRMLFLDQTLPTTSASMASLNLQLHKLRRQELRDGICRLHQRHHALVAWMTQRCRNDRQRLARFQLSLTGIELLAACLLGPGLCGIPFLLWMDINRPF